MRYNIEEFFDKARTLWGDTTSDVPEEFMLNTLNWCFNELPSVPKLGKLFTSHYTANLRRGSYRWKINKDFRRVQDILWMHFYTSTGGEPCRTKICNLENAEFYARSGLVERMQPGIPCNYTIEFDGDDTYLVFDRPLSVPVIVDYCVTGYPRPVESVDEVRDISSIAENLIFTMMHKLWYEEAGDLAFSGAIENYLDNKTLQEAIFQLNKRMKNEMPRVLGGV
jgi:hypothetical protein